MGRIIVMRVETNSEILWLSIIAFSEECYGIHKLWFLLPYDFNSFSGRNWLANRQKSLTSFTLSILVKIFHEYHITNNTFYYLKVAIPWRIVLLRYTVNARSENSKWFTTNSGKTLKCELKSSIIILVLLSLCTLVFCSSGSYNMRIKSSCV